MTFLNVAMLAGLAAVAIPVIIHLLNKQRATVVDWGAMRFLMESMTSRSRRILIEEIILMCLRCLAVALVVLAVARPFLPVSTSVPWVLVLPAALVAVMLFGMAGAMWSIPHMRWILLAAAVLLLTVAGLASLSEYYSQGKKWTLAGGERDVAIVIDGSASMMVPIDGKTNFERAVEEAKAVVDALKPADTVSIILAGAVPRPILPNPTTNRLDAAEVLRKATPTGGSMRVLESLVAANASLAEGSNPAKKIVLLTDGQAIGWDIRNDARWEFLAAGMKEFSIAPQILCRALPLPKSLRNAAVGDIKFSRKVIGPDRPVRIDVSVVNGGTVPLSPVSVELLVDGVSKGRQDTGEIRLGATETVRFDHQFDKPGTHIVSAKVLTEDEMPSDSEGARVIEVIDRLPVLVVEGDPSVRPLDGAASFLQIALTPAEDEPAPKAPAAAKPPETRLGHLVVLTTVAAPDIGSVPDFRKFGLVILANVPRLPGTTTDALRRFVLEGGGLLVVSGDKVLPRFYQDWKSETGEAFMPAVFAHRKIVANAPLHLSLKTFSHPALELITDTTQSDAEQVAVSAYWILDVDHRDKTVRIGGYLDNGDPFLVERKVGKGYVLMTALSLDRRDSNLPARKCYLPLVHELAYYLAAPTVAQANVRPGSEFMLELPLKTLDLPKPDARKGAGASALLGGPVEVLTPSATRMPVTVANSLRGVRLGFAATFEPGLYYVLLPPKTADAFVVPAGTTKGIPFVVYDDAEEGQLVPLIKADYEAVARHVNFYLVSDQEKLITSVVEQVPGEELWKYLALALLAAIMAETAFARWIASQRRLLRPEIVSFAPDVGDTETFRQKARKLLSATPQEPESAPKP